MADELSVRGKVLEVGRKDGTSGKGYWTKWNFNIAHHDTGEKHWYSWSSTKGSEVQTNKSYHFTYTTSAYPNNVDQP